MRTWKHRYLTLCGLLVALACVVSPAVAHAVTVNWYSQGQCGWGDNFDCYSLNTGNSSWNDGFLNNTTASNFIPNGDCQTYAPNCYGGYSDYPPRMGAWCGDYSAAGETDKSCIDDGNGTWGLQAGMSGQTCPCGVHLLPMFSPYQSRSNAQPWGYSLGPVFTVGDTENNWALQDQAGPFHAYVCAFLEDPSLRYIEDCEWTYATAPYSKMTSGVACQSSNGGVVANYFDNTYDPYATNEGAPQTIESGPTGAIAYAFSTSVSQFDAAIAALNAAGCGGGGYDPNAQDYSLNFLEIGIEDWENPYGENEAEQTESGAYAYTTY
jgi:hypothetical protein